ncbi:SPOR domain-containing protein [Azospirillum sp. TSO35-2]|uniref:SPOR domain-containing protein n=1 Tax=Azospirillum sp. TSO35-2 TaxID=716796 RepID=UPI00249588C4|nr:SPOR domain-containing protein [Azospirillum sp. TSO35-2]
MKPTGRPSDAPPPENEDIAKLLRALNEDLRAEPMDDEVDEVDDEPAARGLPLGKIALAMLAAAGIGAAVVMLDPGGKAPDPAPTAAGSATPMVPAPAITRAPAANGAPEPMIARAPAPAASTAPATPPAPQAPSAANTGATAAPPPPMAALPANPPPVLKVPEPPAVPATAPVAPVKPRAAVPAEPAPQPTAPTRAEQPKPEPTRPEPAAKDTADAADSGSLQAMLAPPKGDAKRAAPNAAPPPAAPAAPATAAPPAGAAAKAPAAKASVPAAPPPAGRYTVQVGSFQMTANADALLQKLQGNGFQAYTVDWTDSANRSWRAVRVGGYPDPAAAKREVEQLKAKMGLNPVVVPSR